MILKFLYCLLLRPAPKGRVNHVENWADMAAAAVIAQKKKIAEVRLEKQRQKHDSAEFVRGVLERHDVGRSGSRSSARQRLRCVHNDALCWLRCLHTDALCSLRCLHTDVLCWLVPCRYMAAYLICCPSPAPVACSNALQGGSHGMN